MTECTGYIGDNLGPNGLSIGSKHTRLAIDVSSIVIHKTNKPDIVVNFFDAAGLAGKDRAEVNLSAAQTNAAAIIDLT